MYVHGYCWARPFSEGDLRFLHISRRVSSESCRKTSRLSIGLFRKSISLFCAVMTVLNNSCILAISLVGEMVGYPGVLEACREQTDTESSQS